MTTITADEVSVLSEIKEEIQSLLSRPSLDNPAEVLGLADEIQNLAGLLYEKAAKQAGVWDSPSPSPLVVEQEMPGVPLGR